jgi:hypothetical protein
VKRRWRLPSPAAREPARNTKQNHIRIKSVSLRERVRSKFPKKIGIILLNITRSRRNSP